MNVVVAIPAFNEERTIDRVIQEVRHVLDATSYHYTVLVLDDGSTDKTSDIAKKHGAVVFSHQRNKGLAQTFREEMRQSLRLGADVIVHTDADGQYFAEDIPRMLAKIGEGYDLVLGSRFRKQNYAMPLLKRFGNWAFAVVLSQLTGVRLTDTTTGFRAFRREVAKDITYINTFTYTQEQIIKAAKQQFKIAEIGIRTRKTRESRLFKSPWQYALKSWVNILRIYRDYEPLSFFLRIGGLFLGIGVAIGLWLIYRFITLGYIGRVPSTILSMLLILIGMQIILFGFLADMMKR